MFSYYGAKTKIVHLYPPPKFGRVIEPFAGSARYALRYFEKEVLLVDKFDRLIEVWLWLQKASKADILGLPDQPANLDTITWLSQAERDFCGFQWSPANQWPCNKVGSFRNKDAQYWRAIKKRISESLFKIRHWEIKCGDYTECPQVEATWFIDPPYQEGGKKYKWGSQRIDFVALRQWIENRQGQRIVCESIGADWIDFQPLARVQGAKNTNYTEAIWTGDNRPIQAQLF